jgi:hypothetical protein
MFFEIFQMSLFNPIEVAFEREDSTLDLVISIHVEFRFGRVFVKIPQENPIRSTLVIVLLKRNVLDLFYRFFKLFDRHSLFWSKQSMRKHQ